MPWFGLVSQRKRNRLDLEAVSQVIIASPFKMVIEVVLREQKSTSE